MIEQVDEKTIDAELIRAYFKNGATGAGFPIVVMGLILIASWGNIPHAILLPWVFAAVLTNLARLLVARQFLKSPRKPAQANLWARGHTVLQFINAMALIWGVFVFFLWGNPAHQTFYTLILFALIVGGSLTIAPYRPAVLFVAPPVLLTLATFYALRGDKISIIIGVSLLLLLMFVMLVAQGTRRQLRNNLTLRLEKEDLVERLAVTLKDKNLFLARASHDLRQPLHAMSLFNAAAESRAQDIVNEPTPDAELLHLVQRTGGSIRALSALVNSLLDVSKLDTDQTSPDITDFPINALLNDVFTDLWPEAMHKGLEMRLVPSSAIVRSDPVMLGRILRNLVSNAVRYTLREPKGKVLIGCRVRGDELLIQVLDTGLGIPADEHANVFKEFTRLEPARRHKQEGIGLGLSIVKRMATLLDHSLDLRSEPGRGTVISVSVTRVGWSYTKAVPGPAPEIRVAQPAATPVARPFAEATPTDPRAPEATRIAVIDNDPDALWAMAALLAEWGCEPIVGTCAITTAQALKNAQTTPDLILADYELDDALTGVEAIKDLRAQFGQSIPAALITGRVTTLRKSEADAIDVTIFAKPLRTTHLQTFVQEKERYLM